MTPDPSCCLPGDPVAIAAQIMKREDVGPVLVVSDHAARRLVGIVTDRDLVIKVLAEGRNPHEARVDQAMSPNPVTCGADESVDLARRKMAAHQVRRIPVVDGQDRLLGIIAQADLARNLDEDDVGEMVEEISQPFGEGEWSGVGLRTAALKPIVIGALCFGAGMGLAYLLGQEKRGTGRL